MTVIASSHLSGPGNFGKLAQRAVGRSAVGSGTFGGQNSAKPAYFLKNLQEYAKIATLPNRQQRHVYYNQHLMRKLCIMFMQPILPGNRACKVSLRESTGHAVGPPKCEG